MGVESSKLDLLQNYQKYQMNPFVISGNLNLLQSDIENNQNQILSFSSKNLANCDTFHFTGLPITTQLNVNQNMDFCAMYFDTYNKNQNALKMLFDKIGSLNQQRINHVNINEYMPSLTVQNKQTNDDYIKELNPTMQTKVRQLMAFAQSNNIPFKITDGYRTRNEQLSLIEKYKNQPGRTAGADTSLHRFGRAIDIKVNNLSESQTTKLGNYAKSIGLRWGGDFTTCRERWHFDLPQTLG